jgi:exopolysaccharide production protein ExoZ
MNAHRIRYIDGLRAIAVLAVVFYHSAILQPHLNRGGLLNALLGQGSHGVELFFVLSGFCLAYPTLVKLRDGRGHFDIARYAAHRFVRIAPPYYIAVVMFAVLSLAAGYHLERLAPINVLRQIGFVDKGTDFLNPSFWTLPIEMRWYFILPVALWAWVRAPKILLVAIAVLILAEQTRAGSPDLFALPAFLAGIIAAELFARPQPFARFALPLFILAFAAAMLFTPTRNLYGRIEIGWEITAALFVIAAGASPVLQRVLSVPLLTFIGAASYSIYLVHEPIMDMLEAQGMAPGVAAIAGVFAGVAFWAVAERPFVASPLRDALLRKIEPLARQILPVLGLGEGLALERAANHAPPRVRRDPLPVAQSVESVA